MRPGRLCPLLWAWYLSFLGSFVGLAVAQSMQRPEYAIDLWNAPWSNIGLAAVAAQLGGLWGFLRKITKDEIPRNKVFLHFAMDMIGSILIGAGCLLFAERQEMSVGTTLLLILGSSLAGSFLLEQWMKYGPGLGKPKL